MPGRAGDIIREVQEYGVSIDSGTKHLYKLTAPGLRCYTLPAHNGSKSELDDKYIKGLCKHFGIDYAEFKAKL